MRIVALVFACFVAANVAAGCEVGVADGLKTPSSMVVNIPTYPTCPECGKSHYLMGGCTTTLMGWIPEFENGMLINENPNKTICSYKCLECGNEWRE